MAGWRKKSRRNNGRKSKGGSSIERKLLLKYLQDYKQRALSYYQQVTSNEIPCSTIHQNNNLVELRSPIFIEGVELPVLENRSIVEHPYLAFPKELSGYHRSIIHDICSDDLPLFHCGVNGTQEGDRFVAVSIYSDGLEYVPNMGETKRFLSEDFKPWIMKAAIDSRSKTEDGKKLIWELIDQPGRCLRNAHDEIDLPKIREDTLSTIDPPKVTDITCTLVDSAGKMQQCIRDLENNKPTELAFDIECYNRRKEEQLTCLIQLATNDGREYVIDVLGGENGEVWEEVGGLAKIFADSTVVKVGHGIRGLDVQSLQRDFGIFVVNAFDTYDAANVLDLKGKGLAYICTHYGLQNSTLYENLKQEYQASDWTRRPLTEDMILYGRYDVHFLIPLRKLMMRDMVDHYGNEIEYFDAKELRMNFRLMQAISKSQVNCLKLWNIKPEPHLENKCFLSFVAQRKKEGNDLAKSQLDLYSKLASWRESVAREEELLPGGICSLDFLAKVAIQRPATETSLLQIQYDLPQFLLKNGKRNMSVLLAFVRDSLEADSIVKNEVYPTYAEIKEYRKESKRSEVGKGNGILSNPVFWIATGATLGVALLGLVGDRKRKR